MDIEKIIILESGKCSWGKCIFCSFGKKECARMELEEFKERISRALDHENLGRFSSLFEPSKVHWVQKLGAKRDDPKLKRDALTFESGSKINTLKFFNSGSFLDEAQISSDMRQYLFSKCKESGIGELIVECRAEHVTEKKLREIKDGIAGSGLKLTFAIGLEVADDEVLKKIQKGMILAQYERAANLLKKQGFGVRTYLMANLPFIKNVKASLDNSVKYALSHSGSVAIINAFAYGYSPLFQMWLQDNWHPLDKKGFEALVKKYRKNKKINIYFDDYITYPKFPDAIQKKLVGVGRDYILHQYFNVWQEYISRFYEVPQSKKFVLFLPCSFRKPYSASRTHREILKRLVELRQYPLIHQVMISNPGVIPREFETKYPFAHYDWQEWLETPQIKKDYIEATQKRIEAYLKRHKYKKVFAYFKPASESYIALQNACKTLKIRLISCVDAAVFEEAKKNAQNAAAIGDNENLLTNRKMLDHLAETLMREL